MRVFNSTWPNALRSASMRPKKPVWAARSCVCPDAWPHVWPETSCAHPPMSRVGYEVRWSIYSWKARVHYLNWAPSFPIGVSHPLLRSPWCCSLIWADGLHWRSCSEEGRSWASDGNIGWSSGSSTRLPLPLYWSVTKSLVLRVKRRRQCLRSSRKRTTLGKAHFAHYDYNCYISVFQFTE